MVAATSVSVEAFVTRARTAAGWWGALSYRERRDHLLAWKRVIASRSDELSAVISEETGKPVGDALLEVMLAVEHLDWAARNASRVLRRRRVRSGLLAADQGAALAYRPLGVIAVIGPWNYPVYTPMGSISYALAAGNAVVFKPSEHTPRTGEWLAKAWASAVNRDSRAGGASTGGTSTGEASPVNGLSRADGVSAGGAFAGAGVLQVVTGDGGAGAALCAAGVDKVAFTGSAATGRKVMAACAQTLTPVVIEGGGKDAMIVAADADLDAAAKAAAFGGFGNAGQTCAGVERVYVERAVYPDFLTRLKAIAESLDPNDLPYGPMTVATQVGIVRDHIADALARGGKALVGGLESVDTQYIRPVILTEVPEDSAAMTDETFGPTLVVNPVDSLDEAVRFANDSRYGLAASIFSADRRGAVALAGRLRTGAASINGVLGFAAIPALPFGGVGDSGFGRIHGPDGLREFSRAQSVTWRRFAAPMDLMRLGRDQAVLDRAAKLFRLRHARGAK
jgi:acyl-CoA reductase-like NAD-dependent aldehyde dehydrogenase